MMTRPVEADRANSEHPQVEEVIALSFGLGANLKDPPHFMGEGYCRKIENMYYPRETMIPKTRPGLVEWAAATGVDITAMHTFRVNSTTSYLCFTGIDTTQHLYYIDGNDTVQVISHDLGSLLQPTLITFNGCLLVLIPGQHIQEWQGYTSADPVAAHSAGTVTFTGLPTADQTITVGAEVWVWKATRTAPFQVTIGGTAAACATNLETAINTDSSIVEAVVHVGDNTVCHVSARKIGTAGDLAIAETCDNTTAVSLTGGVNGVHLDAIATYMAPHPGCGIVDWNQRLVVSADPAAPDSVYFSAPENHWQWATGAYGGGEVFELGYLDGTDITAVHEMFGDLVVHKSGQGRTIWRMVTSDPDPANWSATVKKFPANTSAINSRCSEFVTDKHVFLDTRGFGVLTGTDTYDEIMVGQAGAMVGSELADASQANSFFVVNPDENYIMVFTRSETLCWVFHYGSGRWTKFVFAVTSPITCGCYHDALETVVLGTADGRILTMDSSEATDDGTAFYSEIVTRALGNANLKKLLVKQTVLDWSTVIGGDGIVELLENNAWAPAQPLFAFTIEDAAALLRDTDTDAGGAENIHLEDATWVLLASSYGRVSSDAQGNGELVSLRIRLNQGAFALNSVTVRVAYVGRVNK